MEFNSGFKGLTEERRFRSWRWRVSRDL